MTDLTLQIRDEGKSLYQKLAEILCRPGDTKQSMDNKISRALGGYPLWRVRACRLGAAGPFSAQAIRDLQINAAAVLEKHGRTAKHQNLRQAARLEAAATALESIDAQLCRNEIERYRHLARELRDLGTDGPLAGGSDG